MAKKKKIYPKCDICHKEVMEGRLHIIFGPPPTYGEIKGLKQCYSCLGGLTKKKLNE